MLKQYDWDVILVVSPSSVGDIKNQDRARSYPASGIFAVADGVSSSPHSGAAAEIVADNCAALFRSELPAALLAISEILLAKRAEALRMPADIPSSIPTSMRAMMQRSMQEQMHDAYQTTLVAVAVNRIEEQLEFDAVVCGDSAYFCFTADGEVLATSYAEKTKADLPPNDGRFQFVRYGDDLLLKVTAPLLEVDIDIDAYHDADHLRLERWYVAEILDHHQGDANIAGAAQETGAWIAFDTPLLVPSYLLERRVPEHGANYQTVKFSRMLKWQSVSELSGANAPSPSLRDGGVMTAVVPDHAVNGHWQHHRELLPRDAHVVLCSDGFYECFDQPADLLAWLTSHEGALRDTAKCEASMQSLHRLRGERQGDDDMSLIWIRATAPSAGEIDDE